MDREMDRRNTWPLWECIPAQALAKLALFQWNKYGLKLDLLVDAFRDVEGIEEIDRLMRDKPQYKGKVWRG